ncbi:MAG: hypothetical protein V4660_05645 [Pseudomonadota bacterium]
MKIAAEIINCMPKNAEFSTQTDGNGNTELRVWWNHPEHAELEIIIPIPNEIRSHLKNSSETQLQAQLSKINLYIKVKLLNFNNEPPHKNPKKEIWNIPFNELIN